MPAALRAEQLPFRNFGPAEGLEATVIRAIYQDRHGYLWFGAHDGLARFDGERFTNYGASDGLPGPFVSAIAEDRQGRLWVGTYGRGVARLVEETSAAAFSGDGRAPQRVKFVTHRIDTSEASNVVTSIAFDDEGTLWCLTYHGLYRADPATLRFTPVLTRGVDYYMPLLFDSRGRIWAAMHLELVLIESGRVTRWAPPDAVTAVHLRSVAEDSRGRILVASMLELFEYVPPVGAGARGTWKRLPLSLAPLQTILQIWAARDGELWIGTTAGLIRYVGGEQVPYTTANGLRNDFVWTMRDDREGNLWIGTNSGPARLPAEHTTSWTRTDGLPDDEVQEFVAARDGRIYVRTARGGFAEIVGEKVAPLPITRVDWSIPVLQDRRGNWWGVTPYGIQRLRGLGLQVERRFGTAHGIPEGTAFLGHWGAIHEDDDGRIWITTRRGLLRCDAPGSRSPFFVFLPFDGLAESNEVPELLSDRSGNVWFRTRWDVARVVEGRIERVLPNEWRPAPIPKRLFLDSRGRLWVGTRYGGLYMTANPGAREPLWSHYSVADGLSSNWVNALAEDRLGRIYVGTPRGLDRLDLETGRLRRFTSLNGLAGGDVLDLHTDLEGRLWVATRTGLTRLEPRPDPPPAPAPPVLFTRVQVAGEDLALPERGTREIPPLRLGASNNNLLVEYVAVSLRAERWLRYQQRLEGVDTDWSPPGDQRSVNFAHLAPGSYRFLVRAVTREGQAGGEPASLAFEIALPLWRRPWFYASALALLAVTIASMHWLRLRRRLELEAVRTRIATDLHDDIGSNLSRIAILTEVASRDLDGARPAVSERLAHIASVSRDLVDSMSDIVWAVNPARDRLRAVVQRMRRFADDVLSAREIELRFRAPPDSADVPLDAGTRRELFLVFKEAVNNVARHSGASSVQIELAVADGWLSLAVADDGRGFDQHAAGADGADGNGLRSMARRAQGLEGSFEVVSAPGQGTSIHLRIHVGRRPWGGWGGGPRPPPAGPDHASPPPRFHR